MWEPQPQKVERHTWILRHLGEYKRSLSLTTVPSNTLCKWPWRFCLLRFGNSKTCVGDRSHLILKTKILKLSISRNKKDGWNELLCLYSSHLDSTILSCCSQWSSKLLLLSMYFPVLQLIYVGEVGRYVHHNRLRVWRLSMLFPADLQRPKTLTVTQKKYISCFFPRRNRDTYFFPSLTPPTSKAFHKGFNLDLREYITWDRYSCISAGPSVCPSWAVNSSTTSSSSILWIYWKSDMSPLAPTIVFSPTG